MEDPSALPLTPALSQREKGAAFAHLPDDSPYPFAGAIRPSIGLLAVAYSLFGIRPASQAKRPASHANRIARAIWQRDLGVGDAGVEQHAVHAQLHRRGHVAGRAHPRSTITG